MKRKAFGDYRRVKLAIRLLSLCPTRYLAVVSCALFSMLKPGHHSMQKEGNEVYYVVKQAMLLQEEYHRSHKESLNA